MPSSGADARQFYRTLFLSDLHLGARASRADVVRTFLRTVEAETIYLVGDIFDLWHGGRVHWSAAHDDVLEDLRDRARAGARIVYLPGNHDTVMRAPDARIEGWELREAVIHKAADGRRYLVLHGDQCDPRILRWHAMTRLGSRLDGSLRQLDHWIQAAAGPFDPARTPGQRVIGWANQLLAMGDRFENRLTTLARAAGARGVICGHSHKPGLRSTRDGMVFANCGDWVDSLTALAEDRDGRLQLLRHGTEALKAPARPAEGLPRPAEGGALAGGIA
ncbi:UDP-2,3-diacylglucosamine diphosphatase [Salipiger mucosus]|uniref:Ser/Thr protein phosphatase family protein, UDP-2,3-diacylglucosamine hydrolase-like protein n=1 Tax=Salipiger mucosus DSM 16094 TaxID=1123237 RepID=S9QSF3_9RHOB|nr:UDP-2,3-diacylglucosamine diphosphatase [Salipiger mucosus]EPX82578.1 Ser/Thr protein phosphatase family protein, UDP-2,3-diacylglucosamine hydrolase-like protein [Salipiger mucosus DSM 16094]